MSGSGLIPRPPGMRRLAAEERGDVLAYLERRRANARTMAAQERGLDELANDRARQLDIVIHEIAAGLHEGEAEVATQIAEARGEA